MSEIIDLKSKRDARERPDANCVRRDDFGREMPLFALAYEFDGGHWSLELWAYSTEDAAARVAAMRESLALRGQVYSIVPE